MFNILFAVQRDRLPIAQPLPLAFRQFAATRSMRRRTTADRLDNSSSEIASSVFTSAGDAMKTTTRARRLAFFTPCPPR
jgi:hypothetical protein